MGTGGRLKSWMAVGGATSRRHDAAFAQSDGGLPEGLVKVEGEVIGVRALARLCVTGNSRRRRAAALQGGLRPQSVHRRGTGVGLLPTGRRWRATWRWVGKSAG